MYPKLSFTLFLFLLVNVSLNGQICISYDNASVAIDNGNGTCTYDITVIVDSGNGASGTATFFIDGIQVHVQPSCVCNPSTITFPITIPCGATIDIEVFYDGPGNGNDCSGTTGDIILPVEWLDLRVTSKDNKNIIYWSTAVEINNEGFLVEHSVDKANFDAISYLAGAGNSDEVLHYAFVHEDPSVGPNYYRIKQVDFDQRYTHSDIMGIHNDLLRDVNIHPNPFSDVILITGEAIEGWQMLNSFGQSILSGNSSKINTEDIAAGVYYLQVTAALGPYRQIIVKP